MNTKEIRNSFSQLVGAVLGLFCTIIVGLAYLIRLIGNVLCAFSDLAEGVAEKLLYFAEDLVERIVGERKTETNESQKVVIDAITNEE